MAEFPLLTLYINGRDYQIACDPGQEQHVQRLADDIDGRVRQLAQRMGNSAGQDMLMLLATLTMADEMADIKREMHHLKGELARTSSGMDREKISEMEQAISLTIEDIATRIEKIAQRVETE